MKLCIPVVDDLGLDSPVSAHFGSAPRFLIVDTESNACRAVVNDDAHHEHGQCRPLDAIAGLDLEALVVGGIGRGALARLAAAGVPVFRADHDTVAGVVAAYRSGTLRAMGPESVCSGHH